MILLLDLEIRELVHAAGCNMLENSRSTVLHPGPWKPLLALRPSSTTTNVRCKVSFYDRRCMFLPATVGLQLLNVYSKFARTEGLARKETCTETHHRMANIPLHYL